MQELTDKTLTDIRTNKIYLVFFLLSSIAVGFVGALIPIHYVYVHHLTNVSILGGVVFDLVVILFGMSFMVLCMGFIYFVTKFTLGLIEEKKRN